MRMRGRKWIVTGGDTFLGWIDEIADVTAGILHPA